MEENIDTIIEKYGKRTKKTRSKLQVAIMSIFGLLVFAAMTVTALMLFAQKIPANTASRTDSQATNGPTARDVIDKIAASPTILNAKNYAVLRIDRAMTDASDITNSIISSQDNYPFLTNAPAGDGLRLMLTDKNAASSKTAMTVALQETLAADGFAPTTQDTSALSAYKTLTFMKAGTICQILDYTDGSKSSAFEQGVVCSSHTQLQAAYASVTSLLHVADPAGATTAKSVSQQTIADVTSPNRKLLTIRITPTASTNTTSYYFATLDTTYEYLGKRATPSVDDKSSFILSDELKKNISDPKWGTFLTTNIS